MKVSYFAYTLYDFDSGTTVMCDLRPFLRAFSRYKNPEYKNKFTRHGENVYLTHISADVFLILQTRSQEIIKKIDRSDISISEIHDLLEAGKEELGFAAYLCMEEDHFGYASTIYAPKTAGFSAFLNEVLVSIGGDNLQFRPYPLLHQAGADEIANKDFIGKTTMDLPATHSIVEQFADLFGFEQEDVRHLEGVRIELKPRFRKNIGGAVKKVVKSAHLGEVERFVVRAKDATAEHLTDYYLMGEGQVADMLNTKDEREIVQLLPEKLRSNPLVAEKVREFVEDAEPEKETPIIIDNFASAGAWADHFGDPER